MVFWRLYLLSGTGECLFKMLLSPANNRATFSLSRLLHISELEWSSGQRLSIVIRWRAVVSLRQIGCTGEIFIVFSMDHEKRVDSYKTSHAVWGPARFALSISLNQMRFCLDTVCQPWSWPQIKKEYCPLHYIIKIALSHSTVLLITVQ